MNKKSIAFAGIFFFAVTAFAQTPVDLPPDTLTRTDTSSNPISILPTFSGGKNFLALAGYVDGALDSNAPVFANNQYQGTTSDTGFGVDVGGSIGALRTFETGQFSLIYAGDYHHYTTHDYVSGTDQNLNLMFRKTLSPHWSILLGGNAGIFFNGGNSFPLSTSLTGTNVGNGPIFNPFSQNTKFLGSSVSLTYQQNLRWSYIIGGDFFLTRYYGAGSFGSTGGDGTFSVRYRMTRSDTITGTYAHSYYGYQGEAGNSGVDNVSATLSHEFHHSQWKVGATVGVARVNSQGSVFIPGFLPTSINQQLTPVIFQGNYNTTSVVPSFTGSLTRSAHNRSISISGGQSVSPGNGIYLASRNLFFTGFYTITTQRTSLSLGGLYSRLSSISNNISSSYSSSGADVSYVYKLSRYFGANVHYILNYYGNVGNVGGRVDNRITFGITVFNTNIPFSYF